MLLVTQKTKCTHYGFNVSNPSRHVFVAKNKEQVVGTLPLVEDGNTLWITALATDSITQGQGIGSALLDIFQAEGKRKSEAVMLDVEIDNDKALSVYEKAGFKPVLQVDYYVKTPQPFDRLREFFL